VNSSGISWRKRVSSLLLPTYSPFLERLNWSARWMETIRNTKDCRKFATREEMFSCLHAENFGCGARPLDYLEFGVFEGKSLACWCDLNANPRSRFFGFDSFEGLPEQWNGAPAGTYSASGKLPAIDDARVQFIVGWFQQSLPKFLATYRPENPLVIHNDSDLYSSTLFTLTSLNSFIKPGTLVIFDEFYDPIHEYRALFEYACSYMRKFRVVAATPNFTQTAVQIL
jgi:O-methyltransferase